MKKCVLFASFLFFSASLLSQAQNNQFDVIWRVIDSEQRNNALGLTAEQFEALKGSAYVNEEFLLGNIYNGDKVVSANVLLRYNAYSDEIEIKKSKTDSDSDYGSLVKDPEIFVKIVDNIYVFLPFDGSIAKGSYFEILSEEKVYDLYKKTKAEYSAPKFAKTSYDRDKPAEFKQSNSYYLVDKQGTTFQLPKSPNKIYKLMTKEGKAAKAYVKKNHLDLNKERDIIRLVSYYNSLLH